MPVKFTGLAPLAKPPLGTGQARPVRKISSSPETGTVVIHVSVALSNVVEEQVALGEKVIWALGTANEWEIPPAVKEIFPFVKLIVTPLLGTPLALKFALNHMYVPAGTDVPLKFEELVALAWHGGGGGGPGQVKPEGEKLMLNVFVSPVVWSTNVAVPDGEKGPPVNVENDCEPELFEKLPEAELEKLNELLTVVGPRPLIVQLIV